MMICAAHDAVSFLGICGKMHHRNIIVLTDKSDGLLCGLVQCIMALTTLRIEKSYTVMLHNDISVSDELHIQGVTAGMCETSGECSLGQTIPI
jgi:hypothetical protein